jgi:membrane fusion protein (multidrug efflux system)
VKIGGQRGNQWIVTSGLQAGEQVMVDGFQKLRGDAPVKAVPWVPPASTATAPGASGAPAPAASASSR